MIKTVQWKSIESTSAQTQKVLWLAGAYVSEDQTREPLLAKYYDWHPQTLNRSVPIYQKIRTYLVTLNLLNRYELKVKCDLIWHLIEISHFSII